MSTVQQNIMYRYIKHICIYVYMVNRRDDSVLKVVREFSVGSKYSYVMPKYETVPLYVNLTTESCYSVSTAFLSVMKDI
jgi:hypothetical protein